MVNYDLYNLSSVLHVVMEKTDVGYPFSEILRVFRTVNYYSDELRKMTMR